MEKKKVENITKDYTAQFHALTRNTVFISGQHISERCGTTHGFQSGWQKQLEISNYICGKQN